ncbi:MAG: twin-arginine translocase subunit TatC [Chitinophagaceae bacterium]
MFKDKFKDSRKSPMSIVDHLEDLRGMLFKSIIAIFIGAIIVFIYKDYIFDHFLMAPTENDFISYKWFCWLGKILHMEEYLCMTITTIKLQSIELNALFLTAINMSLDGGIVLSFPYISYEIWKFIVPALRVTEKKYTRMVILWVSLCFFTGAAFGYFILAPFTFNFLLTFTIGTHNIIQVQPTFSNYFDNFLMVVLGTGLAFEMPMVVYLLGKLGIVNADLLKKIRKYVIIALLFIAAIITPSPDFVSQLIVAIPLILLYELGVIIATKIDKNRKKVVYWE